MRVDLWDLYRHPMHIQALNLGASGGGAAFDRILLARTRTTWTAHRLPPYRARTLTAVVQRSQPLPSASRHLPRLPLASTTDARLDLVSAISRLYEPKEQLRFSPFRVCVFGSLSHAWPLTTPHDRGPVAAAKPREPVAGHAFRGRLFLMSGYLVSGAGCAGPSGRVSPQARSPDLSRVHRHLSHLSMPSSSAQPVGCDPSPLPRKASVSTLVSGRRNVIWLQLGRTILLAIPTDPFQRELGGTIWTIKYEFACYLRVDLLGTMGAIRRPRLVLVLAIASLALYGSGLASHRSGLTWSEAHGRTSSRSSWSEALAIAIATGFNCRW